LLRRAGLPLLVLYAAAEAFAQTPAPTAAAPSPPAIYPANGQSDEQVQKDKSECSTWATQQTGYDPVKVLQQQQAQQAQQTQQAQTAPPAADGQVARGTVGGAAGGAAIGAIAGNAGKGAAIGAAVGAVGGGARRRKQEAAQQQAQQAALQQQAAQQAAANQKLSDYQRTVGACMEGRGYSVK
jgi:outer membrane lipoprotein SlyB